MCSKLLPVGKAEHTLVGVGHSISPTDWVVVPRTSRQTAVFVACRLGKTDTDEVRHRKDTHRQAGDRWERRRQLPGTAVLQPQGRHTAGTGSCGVSAAGKAHSPGCWRQLRGARVALRGERRRYRPGPA